MPKISDDIKEIEFDEMWHFLERKETQKWIFKAVDSGKQRLSHGLQASTMLHIQKTLRPSKTFKKM
ncbi:hypothetical protein FACS1894126_0550 [Alphaproteobacteria bacterium]|nr:hypothetical protein FACS1894126_0550 [Alphaproteobacteria bacterium]